jgi:hypothetical protein
MDPANSIVWKRKSFTGSLVSHRVWFSATLGSKISSDGSQLFSAQFPWPPMQPQGHHKQESTTFIHAYGSSKQHCIYKEEFHWFFGVVQGWFSAKLGSKISSSDGSQLSAQFPWPPMQPHRHNKQESTTFILPYGSSKQHCMGKEEFHWLFGVVQGWFSAKLGSKISSDG